MSMKLTIIKVGGKVIEDKAKLQGFCEKFKAVEGAKILVHGGGILADQMLKKLGAEPKMLNGRRITDEYTLDTVVMVYGGLVNKGVVAMLQGQRVNAVGVTGMDGGSIISVKRPASPVDYGFAGDIIKVNTKMLKGLIDDGYVPVIAPITGSEEGQLLNTNADTIAAEVAKAFSKEFEVSLIYGFEIDGVLENVHDSKTLIEDMQYDTYQELKNKQQIHSGMIPKLDNAFSARHHAQSVSIGHYSRILEISTGKTKTYTKLSL